MSVWLRRFCAGLCLLLNGLVWAAQTWRFAPLPMEQPETVVAQWRPVLDALSRQLGVEIRIDYSESYAELLDKFVQGRIDLAYLGPLPYVELKRRLPQAEVLVHLRESDGSAFYTCALIAAEEGGISSLKRLKNRRIALTQPLSTCGYFAVDTLLRRAGSNLQDNHYRYLDKHDAVALAVARGDFDLGGVKSAIAHKYRHLGLTVLAQSQPFPGFALVAHAGRVDARRREQIKRLLIESDAAQRSGWGPVARYGAVEASDADYDGVRALLPQRPIPQRGNF
ncbi:MAG: PhnD/SsuA/transferrin family substrate-binding protein [Thiobacillaceae bacterium]|nr:PhnD/SsuA/transferrin family substrate-binding protein [Thiobacillaceae bacterium]MDW8324460.1 PhnD/SsuA/transferrin family substrate-binding protein [Burkholderiales bacterium]